MMREVYRNLMVTVRESWYDLPSWSVSTYSDVRSRLKRLSRMSVHFTIPGKDWAYTCSLSDVISGLTLPKDPIAFKSNESTPPKSTFMDV